MKTNDTLRSFVWAIAFIMLGASCTGHDEAVDAIAPQGGDAISFAVKGVAVSDADTRAKGEISASSLTNQSFGVFASYTGLHKYSDSNVSSDFMYNEEVGYDNTTNVWTYSPLRYWPNGEGEDASLPHYVSFFAYAPYNETDDDTRYCIPSFHYAQEQTNPWLTYRLHTDVAKQVDLLYAQKLDQTKQGVNEKVTFEFNHALACVGDNVSISMSTAMATYMSSKTVKLTDVSIDYTLIPKAKLVLWNTGTANWQPIISENSLETRSVTLLTTPEVLSGTTAWTNTGNGVFYIPLNIEGKEQKAVVHIAYEVSEGGVRDDDLSKSGSVTLVLNSYTDAYKAGKQLDINIVLDNN
ncbi:MAG: fimbrillin family protein [Bacteroidaceae bacterium]|nr:fimbrillin family protein [Bacteroidaceae bacterium]